MWQDIRSTQKIVVILFTHDQESEKEIRETSPFTIATSNIKYLGGKTNQRSDKTL